MTMPDERDVLSALLDREPVDADVLLQLLEQPANRRLLADFVRLRSALHEPDVASVSVRPNRIGSTPALVWRAVAAIALVAVGAASGAWFGAGSGREEPPPEPTRIVKLAPVEAVR